MTNDEILDYVTKTPHNTNRAVLRSMLTTTEDGDGGGGDTKSKSRKDVNFFDYDGTIVESYTTQEWASVSSLPANPSHDGLVAQGWNYTLAQINTEVSAQGRCDIGQMYITASGASEIDIHIADVARNDPYLGFAVNGTAVIDWGDGTSTNTVTGTSLTRQIRTQHTYSAGGDYTIKITVSTGSMAFYGTSSYLLLGNNSTSRYNSYVFSNMVQAVRIGANTSIGVSAFNYCNSLASVTIPNGVTSINGDVFNNCYSLASITIPSSVTSINVSAFSYCYTLASIAIPSSVTNIGNGAFSGSYSLASITIPSSVTSINGNVFNNCYTLASITIPSGVTNIGGSAFSYCYGMKIYHIKPTTPPALASAAVFQDIPSDCIIYVPSASLSAYQSETKWSTYASKMVGE